MANDRQWAAVVPELACSDFAASLMFYTKVIGFSVRYSRPGFAYLDLGPAQLMIEAEAGCWSTGERQPPYGRGINLQIEVADAQALRARIVAAGIGLFRDIAENWYRAGAIERGQREFLIQDPDGYLLRFAQDLGTRTA